MQTETFGATDLLVLQNPLCVPVDADTASQSAITKAQPLWKKSLKESAESRQILRVVFLLVALASALPVTWGFKAALALISSDAVTHVVNSALR